MSYRVLLVEPSAVVASNVLQAGRALGSVEHHARFESARVAATQRAFDFVIANLRLQEFNGLHLVHLVSTTNPAPKCIVYTERRDAALAHEIQRAGAFYETVECLPVSLAGYLSGELPLTDRRDPMQTDRRRVLRGGRRGWDTHFLTQAVR